MAVDDSYTKLLLHMNGTVGGTTFTDEGGHSITASSVTLQARTKKTG